MFKKILCLALLLYANAAISNRVSDWNAGLDVFQSGLKAKHINAFTRLSEEEFDLAIAALSSNVETLTDAQILLEMMRLTRKIGDGHTAVHFQNDTELLRLPIEIYDFDGDWRIVGVHENFSNLLGSQVTHIGGHSVQEVLKRLSDVVQFVENKNSLRRRVTQYLIYPELLHALDIIEQPDVVSFTLTTDGQEQVLKLSASKVVTNLVEYQFSRPLVNKIEDAGMDGLWFGAIENSNTMYIKFSDYPTFEQMDVFGRKLLGYANTNSTKNLIIDLRGNWGGDFYVGLWLSYYLNLADSIDWLNGVYVLVDNNTFSAATINAVQYKQLLNAKVVGESTGSNPFGYQDMGTFELPHSNVMISYSKRLFRLEAGATTGLIPDQERKREWESFCAGEDNVLASVLEELVK